MISMLSASPLGPDEPTEVVIERLRTLDWNFDGAATGANGHGLHPYPAKFPPQLPAQLIEELTLPGDLVLDPFGGSGTALLEAVRLGRRAAAIDANPVAARLTRVKARGVTAKERAELLSLASQSESILVQIARCDRSACDAASLVPDFPNQLKWFASSSIHELAHLRTFVRGYDGITRDVLELAMGQAAARVSFQESETRYVSVPRTVADGEAVRMFFRDLGRMSRVLPQYGELGALASVIEGDARARETWDKVPKGEASLIVTSPPYPNAYDYHLYHRFRILWTGSDPRDLRRVEIGSHLRQQTVVSPDLDYEQDMSCVLRHAFATLKGGAWCVFVVGDGLYKGKVYNTSEAITRLGHEVGFEVAGVVDRLLPTAKRSVTKAGRRLTEEQIVLLRRPRSVELAEPHWLMAPYERSLAEREVQAVSELADGDLSRLTFVHKITLGDGTSRLTQQGALELTGDSRRKNSTYATHGIHRYKGKFYPQLGRCLINLSCAPDSLVLDPFAGSGTVPLEAALLGHRYHGIELSPVGAATARAKVAAMRADIAELHMATDIFRGLNDSIVPEIDWTRFAADTHAELRSWFAPLVLARISRVLGLIDQVDSSLKSNGRDIAGLARVCLSDLIRDVSHQDPSDLRIRRRKEQLVDAPVEGMFLRSWNEAICKIVAARQVIRIPMGHGTIVEGDSTDPACWPADTAPPSVDAIISSPPYAAALPYLDTDRLSLAAVFGRSKSVRNVLETQLVGSREVSRGVLSHWQEWLSGPEASSALPSSTSSFLMALSEAVRNDQNAGFRRRQTPAVLTRYFAAMSEVLALASKHLRSEGEAWFVVGDSRTTVGGHRWTIPTTSEVRAIAKHHGLDFVEEIPITVTRDNMRHSRHAITENSLLHFRAR